MPHTPPLPPPRPLPLPLPLALPLALALLSLSPACYPATAPPPGALSPTAVTWASTQWPGATEAQLAEGRRLFHANCNRCHGYPNLMAIEEGEWPDIVDRMAGKADLEPAQEEAVLRFILAARYH